MGRGGSNNGWETRSVSSTSAPPPGRQTKFTPERMRQIVNLVERGKSREEIAELVGVTVGTLQVTCSKFGISLRRPRFDTGTGYLRPSKERSSNGAPAPEGDGNPPSNGGLRPQSPLQPPPAEQAQIATPHHARARTYEQGEVSFSLRMIQRRGANDRNTSYSRHDEPASPGGMAARYEDRRGRQRSNYWSFQGRSFSLGARSDRRQTRR